jgi:thiamine kinase-like enzyme
MGVDLPAELDALTGQLAVLAEGVVSVCRLSGGLTNTNFKLVTTKGSYVVRISSPKSSLLAIDRENELYNSFAAAAVGVGAKVIESLREPNVMVVEYIEGKTLSARDIAEGQLIDRIALACRRLHGAARFASNFNMFAIQRGYLDIVLQRGFFLPKGYLDYREVVLEMERAMAISPEGLVPCNNDLLAENFIDDGEAIHIIDYEYSGNNEPGFELGNIWSESNLTLGQLEELCCAYYGQYDPGRIARARLWGLMSKYGWTLWGSIQAAVAEIDFDFLEWGLEKYQRAVAEFNSADFEDLLARVSR